MVGSMLPRPSGVALSPRFHPPGIPSAMVPREELLDDLRTSLNNRLIVLEAKAGMGKSTVLAEFASRLGSRATVCWLRLNGSYQQLNPLVLDIVTAMQVQYPDFGSATVARISSAGLRDVDPFELGSVLAYDLNSIPEVEAKKKACVLVIDDFHHVETSLEILTFFDGLIEDIAPGRHLIVASRSRPGFAELARMQANREAIVFSEGSLAFSKSDSEDLIRQILGRRYSTETAEKDTR